MAEEPKEPLFPQPRPRHPPQWGGRKRGKAPKGGRDARCSPLSTAPGSCSFPRPHRVRAARPTEQPSLRGEPQQAPQKLAARERGSEEAGIGGRATHPWLPVLRRVRHPRSVRALPRPAAHARGREQPRGRGGCARAPSSDAQTSLQLPQLS